LAEWRNLAIILNPFSATEEFSQAGRVSEIVEAYKRGLTPPAAFSPERQG
jgi:hypothetical protein